MSVPLSLKFGAQQTFGATQTSGSHQEHEDHPWTILIPDHPDREESPGFRASKTLAKKILATLGITGRFYGTESIQMHHGGSLWLLDDEGWFMVQNEAGIEWSAQFCADPAKCDQLRKNALRLYKGFPKSIPGMVKLGYKNAQKILETPITDAAGIATWVDSIFNSCVALPAVRHTGVLPTGGGRHHYPTPITDIDLVKHDDYVLWVTDPEGKPAAVVPVAKRGAGVEKVELLYASPGSALEKKQLAAQAKGRPLTFGRTAPVTKQAFALQRPTRPAG